MLLDIVALLVFFHGRLCPKKFSRHCRLRNKAFPDTP